jgi:predicted dehydrogenase
MSMPEIPLTDETIYLYTKFISGQIGSIAISTNSYKGSGHSLEVTGTNGSAILKNIQQSTVSDFELQIKLKDGESQKYKSEWVKKNNEDDRILAITKLVNKFGDWIQKKEVQSPNINSGIRVEKLINSSVQSMQKKQIIII